jgi:SSS family solute:Na+ symporter
MAMTQDYIAIGIIFSQMLRIHPLFPIIAVGLATSIYTFIGGVYVSIMTHKYQLPFALLTLLITVFYVCATFDWGNLEPLPPHLKFTSQGAKSIFMFPICIFPNMFFSENLWQRVWAAKDNNSLKKGCLLGGILSGLVVFIFAMFAFLASWSGQQGPSQNSLFNIVGTDAPHWILIIISMLAITVHESTVDSIQNALVNNLMTLAMSFGVRLSLSWTRIVVFLINIPIILTSIQGLDIVSLVLFGDMMTAFAMAPILLSMFPVFDEYINQASLLFCYVFSMFGLLLYGYLNTV